MTKKKQRPASLSMTKSVARRRSYQEFAGILVSVAVALTFIARPVAAYQIVKTNVPIVGDFALDNAKIELSIEPGSIKTTSLRITNRSHQTRTFQVTIEDMKGTDNSSEPVVLLADENGPYSLKDLIVAQISEFTLRHGN
jgi:hypothetical protein